ncbi:uncharacterized protein LOC132750742 [Ruditapes philippinarum]|uniref:uncharacterized protein LOC132750742 n=1 Tax=Ruditapes philippinarum TaxID=129788 RepID=UPI00295B0075|nr:uncharacterized protein LOC132750742 [Ruditapes philippinarum]
MATMVHNQHKINSTKPNIQARSDRLTSPSNSDIYESFELAQDENTLPKFIDGNTDLESTMTDSVSSTFMSVAGCSDSFVSVGQSKLDSDSHFLGASEGDKKANHAMIQELTKSFQGSTHTENKVPLRKHTSLPQCQKYPPSPSFKFGKKDRVPPSSVRSIKDEGVESSNCICNKHDERNTAETSVLPKDNGDIHFHQASTSYSKQNKSADTTKTEKAPHILKFDIRIDDEGINTYENIKFFENKDQNKVSVNENETKRGSNSSTDSTSSSGSSTDSVTYESPDEGAHDENKIILREEEYLCEREEDVKKNLQHNPSGTFLICISGSVQKLWFVTDKGRRCFIIQRQGEKLSLYKNCSKLENMFDNLKQLLYFYHLNDLPSKSYKLKLKRAYKSVKKD